MVVLFTGKSKHRENNFGALPANGGIARVPTVKSNVGERLVSEQGAHLLQNVLMVISWKQIQMKSENDEICSIAQYNSLIFWTFCYNNLL